MSRPKAPAIKHQAYYETISLNLKYYRQQIHKTQAETAVLAGISEKYLSLIESSSASNVPTLEVLFGLADSLGIEPYQLFIPLTAHKPSDYKR